MWFCDNHRFRHISNRFFIDYRPMIYIYLCIWHPTLNLSLDSILFYCSLYFIVHILIIIFQINIETFQHCYILAYIVLCLPQSLIYETFVNTLNHIVQLKIWILTQLPQVVHILCSMFVLYCVVLCYVFVLPLHTKRTLSEQQVPC